MTKNRADTAWILACLAAVVAVVWGPLFWAPFLYDDGMYLLNNVEITGPWQGVAHWLTTPLNHTGIFEPGNTLIHRWLWALAGDRPALYRATSLALHWANAGLVFALARRILGRTESALLVAVLFAVFPAHAEVLAISSFKKHLLVSFFGLWLLLLLPRAKKPWAPAAAAALLSAALLCKESALALPLLSLALSAAEGPRWMKRLKDERFFWLTQAAVCAGFLVWRLGYLPVAGRPLVGGSWPTHLATSAKIFLWYWRKAAIPWPLCPESDLRAVMNVFSWQAAGLAAGLAAAAWACVWAWRRDRWAGAGLAWFCVALSPFLNIPPAFNLSLVADRYLYLAIVGPLLFLGRVADRRPRRAVRAAAAGLALVWSALSLRQAALYASPVDLWSCATECAPANPRTHTAYAAALLERGKLALATTEFERALALSPEYFGPTAQLLLADAYSQQGRKAEAVAMAEMAASRRPTTIAFADLGVMRLRAGDRAGGERALEQALELDALNGDALVTLGQIRKEQGRAKEAESLWGQAAALYPFRARALTELGWLCLSQGRAAESSDSFRRALDVDPYELRAYEGLAELCARDGRRGEGVKFYDELLDRLERQSRKLGAGGPNADLRTNLIDKIAEIRRERDRYAAGVSR